MYILITKELEPEAIRTLRNAKHILDVVADPTNFHFFSEEFHTPTEITADYKDPNKLIINEKLLPHTMFPKYTLQNNYFQDTIYENSNINKEKIFNSIVFKVVLKMQNEGKNQISGKALNLIIKPSENYMAVNFNFSRKKDNEKAEITALINFFHNRKALYFNISKILTANKKKLIASINNEEFVKDLLTLFSIKAWDLVPAFDISAVPVHKELVIFESEKDMEKRKNKFKLLSVLDGNTDSPLYSSGFRRAEVALSKEENLLTMKFDTSLDKTDFFNLSIETLTSNNLEQLLENKKLKELYGNYLNEWLNRYLSLSNFAFKVFEKLQAKVVLNHI
jgi:hypothetical protein